MRRYLAVPVLAVLALALTSFSWVARAQNDPASRALRYLSSQQSPDGSVPGFSVAQGTEDFAIGAHGAGYDPRTLKAAGGTSVYDYLAVPANLTTETAGAGGTGRLVEAVVAGGLDPHAFGGQDLVAKLQSFNSGGTGHYATGAPFDQSLALLGLVAAGVAPPANAATYLKSLQKTDGGWEFGAGFGSDSNTTAMALMALTAAGDTSANAAALGFLHTQQVADGGFTYQNGAGATSDPDSGALGVQALAAAGQDPAGPAWTVSGQTPYGRLLASQDPTTGGFAFVPGTAPDAGTTSQVPAGLELRPFPVRAVHGTGYSLAASAAAGTKALVYLNHQQSADGSLPGFSVAQGSEDFAIGAAAAGFDPNPLSNCGSTVYAYLAAHVGSITADAGSTGRLIEAVVAGRLDPTNFGGMNLVTRLQSFNQGGAYANGAPFSQALAILGLVAARQPVAATALTYLKSLRDTDGGWPFAAGAGSDSNSTAMALLALDAAGDHSADAAALSLLPSFQAADGGFQYQAGFGSDVDSDALVLQALVGANQDPAAVSWAQGQNTVLTHLAASQDADGGFGFQSTTSDPSTTSSVPEGLERLPFPIRPGYTAGTRLPSQPACATPTPAPTPTSTPTPASTPTPTPTAAPATAPPPVAEAVAPATLAPEASPPAPSPSPAASPSPSPSAEPTPSPAASAAVPATPPSGGLPAWLLYALAGAGGLVVVVAGGVALLRFRS